MQTVGLHQHAVRYVAHQLNLWPCVSLPETSPTLRWTGEVGDASVFWVWGSCVFVRNTSVDKLSARAIPCVFLGFVPDAYGWQFYHGPAGASLGAPGAGDAGAGGAGVSAGGRGPGGTAASGLGCARTRGAGAVGTGGVGGSGAGDPTEPGAARAGVSCAGGAGARGAGAGGAGVGGTGAGGAGAVGAGAIDPGAGGAGGTVRPRTYFVPLLQQVLGVLSSTGLTPPLLCPPPHQPQPPSQPASPLPAPFLTLSSREPASPPVSPVRTTCWAPHSQSSLPEVPDPEFDRARAASPTVSRLLATFVTDPSFEFATAFDLVAGLLEFAGACRLDYATALVAESALARPLSVGGECVLGTDVLEERQEDFECLVAAVPRFASMLLAPEGDPDAPVQASLLC
ncbi:unnamed protein product [Closterium sp. NIES-53]